MGHPSLVTRSPSPSIRPATTVRDYPQHIERR